MFLIVDNTHIYFCIIMRKVKIFYIFLVICGVPLIYMVLVMKSQTNLLNKLSKIEDLDNSSSNKTKFVLYWSPFWGRHDYFIGYGFEPFRNCEYKNCYATKDRTFMPLEEFDALIFHISTYNKKRHGVPPIRLPNQKYIFVNIEAPINLCPNLKPYNSFFNWSMTYRFDSDVVVRHGNIVKGKTNYTMPPMEFFKNKTDIAAWFVSHCPTRSKREKLAHEMQKYMPVDIYGRCGKLECRKQKGSMLSSIDCYQMVEKKYKFYLSFENSYCKDYASEKLYNILIRDIVPIAYGYNDEERTAPPNSVINVTDFESVKQLTDYLKYLDQNLDEYLKYFEWKKNYQISKSRDITACQICKKLHEPLKETIYDDLHGWWWGKDIEMCKRGKTLPKLVSDIL